MGMGKIVGMAHGVWIGVDIGSERASIDTQIFILIDELSVICTSFHSVIVRSGAIYVGYPSPILIHLVPFSPSISSPRHSNHTIQTNAQQDNEGMCKRSR
jgi:hypothetical protein